MAEAKQNPAKTGEKVKQAATKAAEKTAAKAEKLAPASYHVFKTTDGKALTFLKVATGRTAEGVVAKMVEEDQGLVGQRLVVVPQRNLKTFNTQVETKTRVKVSAG